MQDPSKTGTLPYSLEPLSVWSLLDRTFKLYAQHLPLLLSITFVSHIPSFILNLVNAVLTQNPEQLAESGMGLTAALGFLAFVLSMLVTLLLVQPLAMGAVTLAIGQIFLGEQPDALDCFKQAFSRFARLLFSQVLAGLWMGLGFMLLIVPGIMWMLSYMCVVPVVMLEPQKNLKSVWRESHRAAGAALERSRELTDGNRWRLAGLLSVTSLILLMPVAISTAITAPFAGTSLAGALLSTVVQEAASLLVTPISLIASVLMYYDLRIRKEGFDIELLQQLMKSSPPNPR